MYKLASYLVREGPLDKSDAIGWALRLATALEVIHRVGVAHGRISAKAIQMLGHRCEAAGFMLDSEDLTDEVAYHSPERLDGGPLSPADDTWAAGVVLYYGLTGALPFPGSTTAQVKAEILASHAVSLASRGVKDEKLQRLVDELFASELEDRVSSLDVLQRRLLQCEPSWEGLPPLKIGKPDMATLDGLDDDDDEQLTALHDVTLAIDGARGEMAKKRQSDRGAEGPDELDELDDAETQLDDSKLAPARKSIPPPRPDAAVAPPPIPDLGLDPSSTPAPVATSEERPSSDIFGLGAAAAPSTPEAARPPAPSPAHSATPVPAALAPAVGLEADQAVVPPLPKSGLPRSWLIAGGAVAVIAVGAALLYGLGLFDGDPDGAPESARAPSSLDPAAPTGGPTDALASSTESAPSAEPPVATASATAGASGDATAAAVATSASPSTSSKGPPPGDLSSCLAPLFPAGTFASMEPKFDFLCTETHARKGGTSIKVEVVRAGVGPGALPEAMQEWAKLGWYEMAVFAVARARCCTDATPLATPLGLELCPLDQSLEQLGKAALGGDAAALQMAIDAYTEVAVCLVQAGASKAFGQAIAPTKIATDTFKQIVTRAAE